MSFLNIISTLPHSWRHHDRFNAKRLAELLQLRRVMGVIRVILTCVALSVILALVA